MGIIRILLLLLIPVLCFGQKDLNKGVVLGRNGTTIDSSKISNNNLVFYTPEQSFSFLPNINVIDEPYSADPTGTEDCSAAFQKAIDSAASQGRGIIIPTGTYKMLSGVSSSAFTRNKPLIIEGLGNVIIDATSMEGDEILFELECTPGSDSSLLADVVKGDTLLKTNLVDVERGDVLEILSTDTWSTLNAGIQKRELVVVRRQSGDTIFLYTPLYDGYDYTTTGVKKTNAGRLKMTNLDIRANASYSQNAMTLRYFRDIDVSNIVITGTYHIGIVIYTTIGGSIRNCSTDETLRDGFGYGIGLQACQLITIADNRIYAGRHCISMGLPCRGNIIKNNILYVGMDYKYPLENHESCEYNQFLNNIVYGGIYMRGINSDIIGNTFYLTKGGPSGVHILTYGFAPRASEYHNIIGNKIISWEDENTSYGIRVEFAWENDTIRKLNISNNTVIVSQHGLYVSVNDDSKQGNYIGNTVMNGNNFSNNDPARSATYFADSATYKTISVTGGIYESAGSGFGAVGHTNSEQFIMNGVTVISGTYPIAIAGNRFDHIILNGNYFKGTDYLNMDAQHEVILFGNTMDGLTRNGVTVGANTNIFTWDGNKCIDCSGSIVNDATTTNAGDNW